ncbi:hypothetical protein HY798_02430 [Candidatus Falkowbacteria bacterium]|nr:hypothetical protein [Candidatus Falkowbacteria bacterium]
MKLILNKNQFGMNAEQFLRRAGYGYIRDRRSGQESFVRRLGGGFYPRLHMYFENRGEQVIFNLHIDQKQPSYEGASAHNAEYEGEIVEAEIERLKVLTTHNAEYAICDMEYKTQKEGQGKKKWWQFWK